LQGVLLAIIGVLLFELIVVIHELGHYFTAKLSGIQVNEFAIGMGPTIIKWKKGETKYSIRLLPIGGFCAMEGEDDKEENDNPRTFQKAKLWKRMIVIITGAVLNIILAFLLTGVVVSQTGFFIAEIEKVAENSPAASAGLRQGDIIIKINGSPIETYQDLTSAVAQAGDEKITIDYIREGEITSAEMVMDNGEMGVVVSKAKRLSVPQVEKVVKDSPAAKAGLRQGDVIKKINDFSIITYQDLSFVLTTAEDEKITIDYSREGKRYSTELVRVNGKTGIGLTAVKNNFLTTIDQTFKTSVSTYRLIWYSLFGLFNGQTKITDMSGPVGMVTVISEVATESLKRSFWDAVVSLLGVMAFLSMNLGVFNLLPLPALDGGRFVFLAIEGIRRKPVKPKYEAAINAVGFACLMLLIAAITIKDVWQLIRPG